MAHAFVWHELDYNNGNITDSSVQLPYVDMGTIRQGSWNKKLFRLKWINTSVENVKLWVDSFRADVGVLPDGLSQQSPEDLVKRYGFKYKYLILNQFEAKNLPDCVASTLSPLDRDPDTLELRILGSIGFYTPSLNDLILLKNQQGVGTTEDNGVYKVYKQKSTSFLGASPNNPNNVALRTGYGVSVNTGSGASYYMSYSPDLAPLSTISYNVNEVKWVLRNLEEQVDDVKYATSINHSTNGSGSGKTVLISQNAYLGSTAATNLAVDDRVLVKSQTDYSENGIYYVTSKYASSGNSLSDPRGSSLSADAYWTSSTGVTSSIKAGVPFDVAVLHGTTYGGRNFRVYSASITPDERDLNWSETTYHNTYTTVTGYLEINDGITTTVAVATTNALPDSPVWSAASNTFTATGAATTLVIDGVNITSSSSKILVKNQGGGTGASNGIYALSTIGGTATTWVLTRTSDFNTNFDVKQYSTVSVSSGTVNAGTVWYLNTQGPITLNTTSLTWEPRSFEYTSGTAATIYGLPLTISATGNTTYTLQTSDTLLIKDTTISDSYKNGIYTVTAIGTTAVARRLSPYNSGTGISALAIKTTLNQNIYGGQYYYMNRADQTAQNFTLNVSGIAISDSNIKFRYSPVSNIILSNISTGYGVTLVPEKITATGKISSNDRILITNQSDAYKNGIWEATSGPTVKTGLGFTDTYTIQNGGLVFVTSGTAGSATTYMLYSSAANGTVPGSNTVKFFSYNYAYTGSGQTTAVAITTVDKLSSSYISPDDFSASVGNSDRVVVNIGSTNNTKNGIYQASVGSTLTYAWNFHSSFSEWWRRVSKTDTYGIETNFIGQDRSLYYVNNFETSTKGNIYLPQAISAKKTTVTYEDTQLENYQLRWIEQDYQKYFVRAAFACTSVPPSTAATGSTLFKVHSSSGSSSLTDGDIVLVICNELYPANTSADFGSTTNFASPNNGIYKARVSSAVGYTGNVYFEKHADWFYSSSFSGATKDLASPYERPTIVRATDGFVAGFGQSIALSKTVFYMQGALKTRVSSNTTGDEGSENFILGSNIYVSYDYANLHTFPKIAPIQHYLDYSKLNPLTNKITYNTSDTLYGTSLSLDVSNEIITYISGTGYTVKKGDRVIFDFKNESYSWFGSKSPYEVSGVYSCVTYTGINSGLSGTPSYIFRKIPYEKKLGHVDYYKILTNNGIGSSVGSTITFNLQSAKDSSFRWHPSTYPYAYIYYSNDGTNDLVYYGTSSLGATSGTIRLTVGTGVTTGSSIEVRLLQQNQTPTSELINYNFISEQILSDRDNVKTGVSRDNTNLSSYDVDSRYWQQKDWNTGTVLTSFNQYTAGTSITGYTTVDYIVNSDAIYSGTGNSYIYMRRLYSDSSYGGGATTGGTFYPTNYFTSSTDFYVGGWSVESNTSSPWYSTYTPIGSTSLMEEVETIYAGGGGTESTILVLQSIKSGNLTADQQSLYYKLTTPVYRTKYGRNDQYVLQFKGANKKTVTLSYDDTSFPSTLEPKRVRVGAGSTYFLNYDPDSTNRTIHNRYWIKDSNITTFASAAVGSTANVDLNNEITTLNGVSLSSGDIVLLKDQTDNTKNGIYLNSDLNYWGLTRATDMDNASELKPFGLVNVSGFGDYELHLPETKSYTIWSFGGSGGTSLIFRFYSENPNVYASAASTTNYSLSSTTIPDIIDGHAPADQDKILLLGQTAFQSGVGYTEKVLARYNKTFQASLSRVDSGTGASQFSIRSLRVNQYSGSGTSVTYETYFDPSVTTVGVGSVNFIPVTSIFNYSQVDHISNSNIDLTTDLNAQAANFDPAITSFTPGMTLLLKDQTQGSENFNYTTAPTSIMLLKRDSSLARSEDIFSNLRVKVTTYDEGANKSGSYGIWFNGTPTIDSDPLFFLKQYESIKLVDCACATTGNVNLSSPPTTIDDYELDTNDRILVKNQSTSSQNGIYYLFNKQSNQWKRASDLNQSYQVVPHLNVYIASGSTNSGRIYVINLTNTPRAITDTNLYPYIIDTDPIAWTNYNFGDLFNSNPADWKDLPDTRSGAADLQSAKINEFGYAESSDIALAIYVPVVSGKLASSNGEVRNQKINVEYDISKD